MDKKQFIDILLDPDSRDDEKDDAAMELGQFTHDEEVESILLRAADDSNLDEMIRATCGESLAEIWLEREKIDFEKLKLLNGIALNEALGLLKETRKDWYKKAIDLGIGNKT
jgi:hypothetical protein